jgi:hypothetical protein
VRVLVPPEIFWCEKLLLALWAAELAVLRRSRRPHDDYGTQQVHTHAQAQQHNNNNNNCDDETDDGDDNEGDVDNNNNNTRCYVVAPERPKTAF